MAVSIMKKLSVVVLQPEADSLLYDLQRLRCVELISTDSAPDTAEHGPQAIVSETERSKLTTMITRAGQAIDFLAEYHKKARGLFVSPIEKEWDAGLPEGEAEVEEALRLSAAQNRLHSERLQVQNEREGLLPWQEYAEDLPEGHTKTTRTVCGHLPTLVDMVSLRDALSEFACVLSMVSAEPVGKTNEPRAVAVTMWYTEYDEVVRTLSTFGFTPVPCTVAAVDGGVRGRLTTLANREKEIEEALVQVRVAAETLAQKLPLLEEYVDRLTTLEARYDAAGQLTCTRHTAVLTGYVPEDQMEAVEALLQKRGDAYEWDDPAPEENVPVLLSNHAMASQFEPVVSLYSLPAYGSFDPTNIMSYFYILIFGLMFADVGYGLLLTLGCLLGKKLLSPEGSLRKFLNMFAMCGISMAVMGVLFGGYFGDLPQAIAQNFGGRTEELDLSLWFNPLNDPMQFLVISLVIGAIHLFTGLAVQFYVLWQKGDKVSAVCDAGSWMLLFLGAGISFLSLPVGLVVVCLGLAMIVCTSGRHEKNPVMKVLKGIMGLYGIVNYVSDLLSYSRILSLGLASAVIASVFNIIGTMAGPSVIGVLLLLVVGTIGHVMNLAINLLGSFVHTSRLQYIEFFGKFYEDGGRPFDPLTPKSRYVRLR